MILRLGPKDNPAHLVSVVLKALIQTDPKGAFKVVKPLQKSL